MKLPDREFMIVAGLLGALGLYAVLRSPFGLLAGSALVIAAFVLLLWRLGRQSDRNTRIAACLFAGVALWRGISSEFTVAGLYSVLSLVEYGLPLVLSLWLALRPGWLSALAIILFSFLSLMSLMRAGVYLATEPVEPMNGIVFQGVVFLAADLAIIGLLLRAWANGFGKTKATADSIDDVFN
ncbi:MAG: hypothetical protein ACKOPQ_01440 [Novosphingobium sp.]